MDRLDAKALMNRYCDGDASAFHGLYALLAPRLLGYLVGIVGDRAAAEDLLQQTFIKVHEARGSYVRDADPVPWIYTIAHRTSLDELRRRRRSRVRLSGTSEAMPAREPRARLDGLSEEQDTPGPDPELSQMTLAALGQLPQNQREALMLTKVQGKSVAEAAAIIGTSPGAIKLRAHRAYVRLRELVGRRRGES